jgi:hypothetical protein
VTHTGFVQGGTLHPVGKDGPVRDQVGVDPRVRLDVGVLSAEECFGVVGSQGLDPVDHLAPGVEAMARGAFGVLVRKPVAHGEQHRRRGVVLRSDELQLASLGLQLTDDGVGHIWFGGSDDLQGRSIGGSYGRFGHAVLLGTTSSVRPGARLCPARCRRAGPRWCSTLTPVTTRPKDSPNRLLRRRSGTQPKDDLEAPVEGSPYDAARVARASAGNGPQAVRLAGAHPRCSTRSRVRFLGEPSPTTSPRHRGRRGQGCPRHCGR